MKTTIIVAVLACLAIASADWLVKTPCTPSVISVDSVNGNCVSDGTGFWYLVQCSSSGGSATDYYCTDAACSKCTKERNYSLGNCQGAFKYDCMKSEPNYSKYISGPYFLARNHDQGCSSTVAQTEATVLNTCYMSSAYGSAQYQCINNILTTLNYDNSNCQGTPYDTSSISVPSCRENIFSGATDYACYGN